ncbi:zinc finger CCCH domain-containing protein 29-like [Cornus florida]|uniref:zinc finger CCCH domain-containing protein 29-like n=1 Tax=Cornus florida TaxID=4283 RepID=UPI00289D8656|nr:zinc finger CCCH domain-containing protein 29-like [Cornus florida]
MCSGSKSKLCPYNLVMKTEIPNQKDGFFSESSILLELSASDDLGGFRLAVEEKGFDVEELCFWYGRRIGSKKMGFEERTPLMIASMYGSTEVLKYIIGTGKVDVNRACGSDGATALHCSAAGGSTSSVEVIKLLLDASADVNSVDANGNKPGDLIATNLKNLASSHSKMKMMEMLLNGGDTVEEGSLWNVAIDHNTSQEVEQQGNTMSQLPKEGTEKKEYPIDITLPDINNGMYGSDEFRMYSFKVKPCSRAYSHDWTECPFVHPGENARRRDPRKYSYSCVPCPEFRKGSCVKGDGCEYAHGVFESWLHPAQYRTRLCKDETGCSRKVCFFAHKPEELRPLYASTGSAMPSPRSVTSSAMDMATLSPMALGSSSLLMPSTSSAPMSPSAACSSPMAGNMWHNNKVNLTPPALQLPGSRLKTALSARDLELEIELLKLDNLHFGKQHQQQLIDEMSGLSSPSYWNKEYNRMGDLKPTNLDDVFGSLDPSLLSPLQGNSPKVSTTTQLQSSAGVPNQMRQNMNLLRASYPSNVSSSPVRKPSIYGFDSSGAVAAAVMNSRSNAFAKRSQSFIDRGAVSHHLGLTAAANSASLTSSSLSDWSSPNGKLDWGFQGEEHNKLKKSASFGFRSGNAATTRTGMAPSTAGEPDVSWVNSLVKDVSSVGAGLYRSDQTRGGAHEMLPPWVEQLYIDQEQMVA